MHDIHETMQATPILDSGVLPPRKPPKMLFGFAVGLVSSLLLAGVIGLISTRQRAHDGHFSSLRADPAYCGGAP